MKPRSYNVYFYINILCVKHLFNMCTHENLDCDQIRMEIIKQSPKTHTLQLMLNLIP